MKTPIKALLLSLALASSSFSARSASQTDEYMQYSFHYNFSEKVDLALTHYLQFKQEMEHLLSSDINEQTEDFFRQYQQQSSQQLTRRPSGLTDDLSDQSHKQTAFR
jgi:dipeptidase